MARGAKGAAWIPLAPLLLALAPLACVDLPDLSRASCGDGFLDEDRGEDCDGDARSIDGRTYECDREQCRLKCDPARVGQCSEMAASAAGSAAGCCPPGWGCGVSGVCSERSNELVRGSVIDADVSRLVTADFDGDGLEDVLSIGASELSVHYFEEDEIIEALRLSVSGQVTAVGEIAEGDPGASTQMDLALTVGAGVGVLRGGAEHEFTPLVYPVPLEGAGSELLMAGGQMVLADPDALDQDPSDEVFFVFDDEVFRVAEGFKSYALPGPVVREGGIAVGDVNPDTSCEELVLPLVSDELLYVYAFSACAPGSSLQKHLPGARQFVGSVQVLDIDRDGSPEVAVGELDQNYDTRIVVLRYEAGALVDGPTVVTKALQEDQICAGGSTPLAIGDLDRDCLPDYVDPCQIVISGAQVPPMASCAPDDAPRQDIVYFNTEAPWSAALIRDFNGDGDLDVVAGSESSAGLSFYSGTGAAVLNPSSFPARVEVAQIVAGDFDGDSITDVGILERSRNKPESAVLVAFGQHLGTPELPLKLGEVRDGHQILAADYAPLSPIIDGMSDLGVLSVPRPDAVPAEVEPARDAELTLFAGHARRLMQSAVHLTNDLTLGGEQPKQIALGRFGPDGAMEIAALALVPGPPPWARIWRIPFGSRGEAEVPLRKPEVLRGADGYALDGLIAVTTQIAAIRSPNSADKLVLVSSEDLKDPAKPSRLRVFGAASDISWSIELGPLDLPGRLAPAGLGAEDLDQDGWEDLSLLLDAEGKAEARALYVLWNGPEGLSLERMTRIAGCFPGEPAAPISGVAWAAAESAEAGSGILVSGGGACRVELREDPHCDPDWVGGLGICRQAPWITPLIIDGAIVGAGSPAGGPSLVPGSAMAMGDINGDGLLDLVAGEAASFRVFLARAKQP